MIDVRNTKQPAREYIARAVLAADGYSRGFLAEYAFPGVVPFYVSENGTTCVYDTYEEAENMAHYALVEALNNRPRDTEKRERYQLLTGPELAVLLARAGLTPTFFAYLWNTTPDHFFQWVDEQPAKDGRRINIPHPVRLLLEIFSRHPESVDTAEEITEAVTTERKPRKAKAPAAADSIPDTADSEKG